MVESITGVPQRETVPDEVVRRADQIELVDMSPEALRRRMAHGNVYAPEKVDAALSHYFRVGNLTALRELALLWVADRVDSALETYRAEQGIAQTWPARERVVVALTGGPEGEALIRNGARIASRGAAGELMAVYVSRSDGLTGASPGALAQQRTLVESLGGTFHSVVGEDTAAAILDFARGVNASQIVLGSSRRSRLAALTGPGVGTEVVRGSGDIDVHMVTHDYVGRGRVTLPRGVAALGGRRTAAGWVAAVAGPPALAGLLSVTRTLHTLPLELMLFLALTVGVALVGGLWPALAAAVLAGVVVNYFFVAPLYTLTIDRAGERLRIARVPRRGRVGGVGRRPGGPPHRAGGPRPGRVRDAVPARRKRAARGAGVDRAARAGARDLRDDLGVPAPAPGRPLCMALRGQRRGRAVSEPRGGRRRGPGQRHPRVGAARTHPARRGPPAARRVRRPGRGGARAAPAHRGGPRGPARGGVQPGADRPARGGFTTTCGRPLSSIKASVSSLRQGDVTWDEQDRAELLATIEESADRLDALVGNLLDMSRLQTGTVVPHLAPVALDAAVAGALVGLPRADEVQADVPEDLPAVLADAGLLERVIANIVENALKHSPDGRLVRVTGSALGRRIELRVVDRGPGVRDEDKGRIFEPFQRLGDAPGRSGVGLGLAVARGFAQAMSGQLEAEDTPGGGLDHGAHPAAGGRARRSRRIAYGFSG